jgi:hypothetical protein
VIDWIPPAVTVAVNFSVEIFTTGDCALAIGSGIATAKVEARKSVNRFGFISGLV